MERWGRWMHLTARGSCTRHAVTAGWSEACLRGGVGKLVRFGLVVAALLSVGCSAIPEGRVAVDDVEVVGAEQVDADELLESIATHDNPRFLGLFEGVVYDYALFDEHVLERDLARIERAYRARGYYDAHVRAGRVRQDGDEVVVEIHVDEGEPVVTAEAALEGVDDVPDVMKVAMRLEIGSLLPVGSPFDERKYERAHDELHAILVDHGYAWAEVEREARVDLVSHRARVRFIVTPGPRARFGEVTYEGLGELPARPLLGALAIDEGELYDHSELVRAQQDALELGLFSSVTVTPDLGEGPPDGVEEPAVPVHVEVTPASLRTVRAGGGVKLDAIEADVHGLIGWESRNFLGGARRFRVDLKPGLTLYPLRINNWVAPNQPLPKGRLEAELRQPSFIESRTTGLVEASFAAFPVLLKTDPQPDDPVIGYVDAHGAVGLARRFWKLNVALRKHVEYARPFAYVQQLDPLLEDVVLGYPELILGLDLRDDPLAPHEGLHVETALQSALYADGKDFRVAPTVRGYVPIGDEVTLALRAGVGFLFPFDYGDTIGSQLRTGDGANSRAEVRDLQLLYFRGFFGGGPRSNRGYPPRTLGPHAPVPFLSPASAAAEVACENDQASSVCSVPIGGQTTWDASVELRYPILDPLSGATFCDAADVAPGQVELRFNRLHLSCGSGLRYGTPVGAIRLDVAVRIPGAQTIGVTPVERIEGDPGTIFGAPVNVSFGIGEAF